MNAAFRSIFIAFCLIQAVHGQPAELAPSMRLRAEVQVSSRGIFLSDIVENPGDLASIRVADAPVFGRSTMWLRAQAAEMIHVQLPEVTVTNWAGAARIRISRKTQMLDESMLKELLSSTLQRDVVRDRGELELRLMRPWVAVSVPMKHFPFECLIFRMPVSSQILFYGLKFRQPVSLSESGRSRCKRELFMKSGWRGVPSLEDKSCNPLIGWPKSAIFLFCGMLWEHFI